MTPETRKILDVIEDALIEAHKSHGVTSELWDILTALRGPDEDRPEAKNATIEVRVKAFPRLAKLVGIAADFSNHPMFVKMLRPSTVASVSKFDHFESHIYRAMKSLSDEPQQK